MNLAGARRGCDCRGAGDRARGTNRARGSSRRRGPRPCRGQARSGGHPASSARGGRGGGPAGCFAARRAPHPGGFAAHFGAERSVSPARRPEAVLKNDSAAGAPPLEVRGARRARRWWWLEAGPRISEPGAREGRGRSARGGVPSGKAAAGGARDGGAAAAAKGWGPGAGRRGEAGGGRAAVGGGGALLGAENWVFNWSPFGPMDGSNPADGGLSELADLNLKPG